MLSGPVIRYSKTKMEIKNLVQRKRFSDGSDRMRSVIQAVTV